MATENCKQFQFTLSLEHEGFLKHTYTSLKKIMMALGSDITIEVQSNILIHSAKQQKHIRC